MPVEQSTELQRMPCKLSTALSVIQEDRPEHGKCDGKWQMGTEKTHIFTFIFSDVEQVLQKAAPFSQAEKNQPPQKSKTKQNYNNMSSFTD